MEKKIAVCAVSVLLAACSSNPGTYLKQGQIADTPYTAANKSSPHHGLRGGADT